MAVPTKALLLRKTLSLSPALAKCHCPVIQLSRCLSTTFPAFQADGEDGKKQGLFSSLFVRKIEATHVTQSKLLSEPGDVYQIQFHSVKPECMEAYLKQFGTFVDLMKSKDTGASLVGSWTVEIGDQDEAIHVWKYEGGYPVLNDATYIYRTDKDFIDFRLQRNKMLRARRNQIVLRFSFWPEPVQKDPGNIYEMRTYTLKPGTMIEWGNIWQRGIKHRMSGNEAIAGYFSHIGDLHQVHHFWSYKSLQERKEIRESAWVNPGWDETVAYTVPLIRTLQSRILVPTPFSPLK
ncbi:protein NipSnap-like isoform X1 [Lingula anatina]|uniref:Protein NipSnap-like isoform X1 n=1 Tax=Lingula anatina TaxID=7574 RepID=A0A1S3H692_LINAN|nr:protein NipSnap-like isoform X1 [Lingula anatina]|eukprot:XP_013381635.1 protein NipSnap-like isoform X1 [Lingula anatina]